VSRHDELRVMQGAYVLGGLSAAERRAVDEHVVTCVACRDELARLAVVPGLLRSSLDVTAAAWAASAEDGPQPSAWPRLLAAAGAERVAARRGLRRWRSAALLASCAAVILAVVAGVLGSRPGPPAPPPPGEPMVAVATAPVQASGLARLEERGWGTAVALELQALPTDADFVAWAVARDGRREQAARWGPTPSGRARLQGATSILRAELARLEVATATGRTLLVATG
jgi:anti-sigma-K factor RskA